MNTSVPLFSLGRVVATPGALDLLAAHNLDPYTFLSRHVTGDWGDLDPEDVATNAGAVEHGWRLLSNYPVSSTERLWIITEADRSVTTLLLPSEY